jgi:hypothetical protein
MLKMIKQILRVMGLIVWHIVTVGLLGLCVFNLHDRISWAIGAGILCLVSISTMAVVIIHIIEGDWS